MIESVLGFTRHISMDLDAVGRRMLNISIVNFRLY